MSFVVFLGCDGCGKSTVIARLEEELGRNGREVLVGHWCPSSGRRGKSVDASDPHGQVPRGLLSSVAKLGALFARWWKAWIFQGWGTVSREGVVLFDRYYGDLCVDPIRYRYGGPVALARMWARMLPRPDHVFFLDADPAVLLSRKQEVMLDELGRLRTKYSAWVDREAGRIIDVDRPVEEIVEEIRGLISERSEGA